jgi:hypothetical protein
MTRSGNICLPNRQSRHLASLKAQDGFSVIPAQARMTDGKGPLRNGLENSAPLVAQLPSGNLELKIAGSRGQSSFPTRNSS